MMDTGLANAYDAGDIRVAEPIIPARHDQGFGASENIIGSGGQIAHTRYLPSSRLNVKMRKNEEICHTVEFYLMQNPIPSTQFIATVRGKRHEMDRLWTLRTG